MAIIAQKSLFVWEDDINSLGDLERLRLVMESIPDEELMGKLEASRGRGRNDYPVRAMWNLVLAGRVFEHSEDASLLRELRRNRQLAYVCGFEFRRLPEAHNLSRFRKLLLKFQGDVDAMLHRMNEELYSVLEGYGEELAMDSKWVKSAAGRRSKRKRPDGRSESDARLGKKAYSGVREDGSKWEKTVSCFGFKIHLLVDAVHELPIAYEVTDAAASDITEGRKLLERLAEERSGVLETCHHLMGDRGYDDGKLIGFLKGMGVKAVIDKRVMRRGEPESAVPGYPDAYYDEHGNVYCYEPQSGARHLMTPNGYESGRDALRFKCPAQAYGIHCSDIGHCRCRNIRVPLATDPRIFTQVQRESHKWKRLYRMRTSVERVNSRLDMAFGFEENRTRGLARTKQKVSLSLLTMLGMALGRIRLGHPERIRSHFKAA